MTQHNLLKIINKYESKFYTDSINDIEQNNTIYKSINFNIDKIIRSKKATLLYLTIQYDKNLERILKADSTVNLMNGKGEIEFFGYIKSLAVSGTSIINVALSSAFSKAIDLTLGKACNAKLGDSRCKYDINNSTAMVANVVYNNDSTSIELNKEIPFGDHTIEFTSGSCVGMSYQGFCTGGNVITISQTIEFAVSINDFVIIKPICNKTYDECKNKFNNLENFRGFTIF